MTRTPDRGEYSGLGCASTTPRSLKETTADLQAAQLIGVE
jgi:hypothetical protein